MLSLGAIKITELTTPVFATGTVGLSRLFLEAGNSSAV